jgi:hypothetical protein
MNGYPIPDAASFQDRDIRQDRNLIADNDILGDDHAGVNLHPISQSHPGADNGTRINANVVSQFNVISDVCRGMNPGGQLAGRMKKFNDLGKGHQRMVDLQEV